jgi:hypothetical protein
MSKSINEICANIERRIKNYDLVINGVKDQYHAEGKTERQKAKISKELHVLEMDRLAWVHTLNDLEPHKHKGDEGK